MTEGNRRALVLWAPVAAWCALIFGFSSVPDLKSGLDYDYPLRKLAHMAEYGILWFLTRRALDGTFLQGRAKPGPVFAAVFAVLYAMSDEWHQSLVPGRAGRWSDVLIDAAGVALAWAAAAILARRGLDKDGSTGHP